MRSQALATTRRQHIVSNVCWLSQGVDLERLERNEEHPRIQLNKECPIKKV